MSSASKAFQSQVNKTMFRTGTVIIVSVLLFTFVLPIFYPYSEQDVFYVTKNTTTDCGEACVNDEFRLYPADESVSLPTNFIFIIKEALTGADNIEFNTRYGDKEYVCRKVIDGVYTVSDSSGVLGVMSDYVIDFYDSFENEQAESDKLLVTLFMSADDDLKVYSETGIAVGELSKYIIRTSDGNDSFSYDQKQELKEILFGGKRNGDTVYSETMGCELVLTLNADSVSFARCESRSLIDTYGKPSLKHLLGTDANGTDVLARLMYGGRISLSVGIIAATAAVIIGTLIGCISGINAGVTDTVLMRFVDVFDALPALPFFLIIGDAVSNLFLPPGMSIAVMIIILAFFSWTQTAKIIRIKLIELNSCEDSLAAEISGIKTFRKITVILFPKILPQIISFLFIGIGSVILTESSVSFFGLGVRFPYSTWGIMLSDSTTVNELGEHPSIWLPTVFMICITVLGFYFLGESFVHKRKYEDYYHAGVNLVCEHTEPSELCEDILRIENLTVEFSVDGKVNTAVKNFSMTLKRGEAVAIVGASGCGKSVTADVIAGLLSQNGTVRSGKVFFNPVSHSKVKIGYILQEPMSCFDPVMSVGKQLEEAFLTANPGAGKIESHRKVIEMIKRTGFDDPEEIYRMYPGQLSGGMCQRIMAASVLLQTPELIIADEPCSSLDTHSKIVILDLLKEAVVNGVSLVIITHNIHEAEYVTGNIVSFDGKERAAYKSHIKKFGGTGSCREFSAGEVCLKVSGMTKTYKNSKHIVTALSDVSFELKKGAVLGITGDEGSGKTTLAGVISGIVRPDSGSVYYRGRDIAKIKAAKRKSFKGKIQMIFQHPYNSLSKNICVGKQIREVVRATHSVSTKEEYKITLELMRECGLDESLYYRYPDTLSGGQCKRVCIARALASKPDILICDEPLAYLDTDLHRQITGLLRSLSEKYSVSLIFISHDLDSLKDICDEIIVMDNGAVVEYGSAEEVLKSPVHHCTVRMISENNLIKNSVSQSRKEEYNDNYQKM